MINQDIPNTVDPSVQESWQKGPKNQNGIRHNHFSGTSLSETPQSR